MTVVKKESGKLTKRSRGPGSASRVNVELPLEPSEPSTDLSNYLILLYGEKKIGKTTLMSRMPRTLFLMFEPGAKALRIHQVPVSTWYEFTAYIDLLEKDKRFDTVVVDTVDVAYNLCFDAMCTKMMIQHPSDENDYGKSWGVIKKEFMRQLTRLLQIKGVVLISHSTVSDIKSRTGEGFQYMEPTMSKQAKDFLTGVVDLWAYYGYVGAERRLLIQGDEFIGSGNRLQEEGGMFHTADGRPIVSIPMGGSSSESYANLIKAFENKQVEVGDEMLHPSKKSVNVEKPKVSLKKAK